MTLRRKPGFWSIAELLLLTLVTPLLLFTNIQPILTIVMSLLWLGALAGRKISQGTGLFSQMPYRWLGFLLIAQIMLGILVSADYDLTIPKAAGLLLGFGWYQLLSDAIPDWLGARFGLVIILVVSVGITGIGVVSVDFPNKIESLQFMIDALPKLIQFSSSVSANQLAGTILLYAPLLVLLSVTRGIPKPVRIVSFLLIGAIVPLMVLTQSRSGWLGGIGAMCLIMVTVAWRGRSWKMRRAVIAAGVVAAIAVIVVLRADWDMARQVWNDPSVETSVGTLDSVAFRQEVWYWALITISDFPLTGTGLGTFREVVRRLYPIAVVDGFDIAHAHNVFLQIWLDIGLLGLIAYVGILFRSIGLAWQLGQREGPLWRAIGLGMVAVWFGFHVFGMTDALAFGSKTHLMFWLGVGLVTGVSRLHRNEPNLKGSESAVIRGQ